jgi:Uma2 family endonuclease
MGDPPTTGTTSYDEYLAIERATDQRHEWLDGRTYAMAGGTLTHGALAAAIGGELRALALSCGGQVYSSDAKVRILATGLATYPDASVVCGALQVDPADAHAMVNPAMLVEVLSAGTESYDRGEKFEHYRRIESLRDYVMVSQYKALLEVYSRGDDNLWTLREAGPGQSVPLTALRGVLDTDRVYAGIALPVPPLRVLASR